MIRLQAIASLESRQLHQSLGGGGGGGGGRGEGVGGGGRASHHLSGGSSARIS